MSRKPDSLSAYKLPESLYNLAFDQYSRQFLAKRLIEANRSKPRLKILDVGGYKGVTREFFPTDEVTVLDLFDVKEPGYVMGSALDMPFSDGAYDAVVCFDVYEHIEADDREQFVREMHRVTNNLILIAAPFDIPMVADAEITLNAYYQRLQGQDHLWLKEHIDNGLPNVDQLENCLTELKLPYQVYHSNNITLWSAMQDLIFLADALNSPERVIKVNEFYNRHFDELGDGLGLSYRLVYLSCKTGEPKTVSNQEGQLKPERLQSFINQIYESILELIYSDETVRAQAELLGVKDRQIAELRDELHSIYQSKSWRVTMALRKLKHTVLRLMP